MILHLHRRQLEPTRPLAVEQLAEAAKAMPTFGALAPGLEIAREPLELQMD